MTVGHNRFDLSLGLSAALGFHVLVFAWLVSVYEPYTLPVDMHSSSASVNVRFVTMQKNVEAVKPVVQKEAPKPIKKILPKKKKRALSTPLIKETVQNRVKVQDSSFIKNDAKRVVPRDRQPAAATESALKKQAIPVVRDVNVKGRRVSPRYPAKAQRLKQEGVVLIRVLISESGKREDIKIYAPSKHAMLNRAALKAVKKWTFEPYIKNGKAVRSWVEIPIEFKLK